MTTRYATVLLVLLSLAATVTAQAPPPAVPPQPPVQTPNLPSPQADFSYSPEGRRDPFVNLSRRGTEATASAGAVRPMGAAGLLVDELLVRGIVESQGAYVAMVSGPAGKTFTVRAGSKLFDGSVRSITPQAVVITQQVSDPLSLQKQREVRKPLRVQEEGK